MLIRVEGDELLISIEGKDMPQGHEDILDEVKHETARLLSAPPQSVLVEGTVYGLYIHWSGAYLRVRQDQSKEDIGRIVVKSAIFEAMVNKLATHRLEVQRIVNLGYQ